uniref:Ig-like domain-containing protein n=1 Tax=Oncorhynchus mykiss TaxID=8022 RepID=A0A8K9XH58_ONCMY
MPPCSSPHASLQQSSCLLAAVLMHVHPDEQRACSLIVHGSLNNAVHQSVEWQRPDLKPKEVHLYRDEKDDLVLQNPVFRGRTSLFKEELENGNTSLKLTRVKLSDAGNYTCYIPLLDHQKTIIQLLVGAVSRPVIIIERMEGDEVVLRCEAEGCYPEPVMEWCDAQGRVLPAAGPTETSRDRKGCYTVTSHVIVPNSDNNTFTCRAAQQGRSHCSRTGIKKPDYSLQLHMGTRIVLLRRNLKLGCKWVFQMDNDPKQTSKVVAKWLKDNKVKVLELASQSPDLNSIEHLWAELKKRARARRPTNLTQLHQLCQEEWAKIHPTFCGKLVEGYPIRLTQVKQFKGNATKY